MLRLTFTMDADVRESDPFFADTAKNHDNELGFKWEPGLVYVRPTLLWDGPGVLRDYIINWRVPIYAIHTTESPQGFVMASQRAHYSGMLGERVNWKIYSRLHETGFTFMSHGRIPLLPGYGMILLSLVVSGDAVRAWGDIPAIIATADGVHEEAVKPT